MTVAHQHFPGIYLFNVKKYGYNSKTIKVSYPRIRIRLKGWEDGEVTEGDASGIAWRTVSTSPPSFIPFKPAQALMVTEWSTYWTDGSNQCSIKQKRDYNRREITKANNSTHAFRFFFHLRIEKDTKEKITAFARAHIDKRKP